MTKSVEIFAIIVLGFIAVFAAISTGHVNIWSDNFAANFGRLAGNAFAALGLFMGGVICLPPLTGIRPVVAALIGSCFVIALSVTLSFWIDDVISLFA